EIAMDLRVVCLEELLEGYGLYHSVIQEHRHVSSRNQDARRYPGRAASAPPHRRSDNRKSRAPVMLHTPTRHYDRERFLVVHGSGAIGHYPLRRAAVGIAQLSLRLTLQAGTRRHHRLREGSSPCTTRRSGPRRGRAETPVAYRSACRVRCPCE